MVSGPRIGHRSALVCPAHKEPNQFNLFRSSSLGALALLGTSLGAIVCHLIWDSWNDAVPAMITASLSSYVAWANREPLLQLLGLGGVI